MAMHVLYVVYHVTLRTDHCIVLGCEYMIVNSNLILKSRILLILAKLFVVSALQSIIIICLMNSFFPRHRLLLPHIEQIKAPFVFI